MKIENYKRGYFKEISLSSLNEKTLKSVVKLVDMAKDAEKVDEHGNWNFYSKYNYKGEGSSVNWDLYGIGKDYHTKKMLIIIQIRQCVSYKRSYHNNIRKNYFLIGTNEDKTVFAHPVEARVVHSAVKRGKDVIYAVQSWMFDDEYKKVIRQGDLSLIPVKRPIGEKLSENQILIESSHQLCANEIFKKSEFIYYANCPVLTHTPQTHMQVSGEKWYKIIVGKRTFCWDFAAQTKC